MAKKTKLTEAKLVEDFMNYTLDNGHHPESVYKFMKENGREEQEFYAFYGSIEGLRKAVFELFMTNTLALLEKNEEFQSFDSRNKLLSFYFTFFEMLTANRSYVLLELKAHENTLKALQLLAPLRKRFKTFISTLDIEMLDVKSDKIQNLQEKGSEELAWFQLLTILRFWMNDTSSSFEKTDTFIEKSVNTAFNLIDVEPMKSIIDLGKFIFKERVKFYM